MNLRHSYEQLIADKLRKLPAPDVNTSWQQMKRLLDDDNDTQSGGKRPPGNKNSWWQTGALLIVVAVSLWLYVGKTTVAHMPPSNTVSNATPGSNNKPAEPNSKELSNSSNNQTAAIDKNITLNHANATTVTVDKNKISNASKPVMLNNAAGKSATGKTAEAYISKHAGNKKTNSLNTAPAEITSKTSKNNIAAPDKTNQSLADNKNGLVENNAVAHPGKRIYTAIQTFTDPARPSGKKLHTYNVLGDKNTSSTHQAGNVLATSNQQKRLPENNGSKTVSSNPLTGSNLAGNYYLPVNQVNNKENNWLDISQEQLPSLHPSSNASLAMGDSIEKSRNTVNLLNGETKKSVAKAQREKEIEDLTRKDKKSLHLNLSNVFKPFSLHLDTDPRWAAGIALNSSVPLNAQRRYNYSMNAKSGILTDYIPSVYVQFHLNEYVYAQTEINFVSPQYTPQLLIYQQDNGANPLSGTSQQKSIFIQKLYYFSLPLSLHYSPVNNFYFSAGLQFSSFQSGLVSVQQKEYITQNGPDHPTSISNSILKFKDDSIAAKLSPNEWRWQAGADYYWNRFTVGLRYNRSFKNLLNVNLSPSLPPTSMRNESLLFYVRYNLFESRKK